MTWPWCPQWWSLSCIELNVDLKIPKSYYRVWIDNVSCYIASNKPANFVPTCFIIRLMLTDRLNFSRVSSGHICVHSATLYICITPPMLINTRHTLPEGGAQCDRKYVCGGFKCQPTASYFECCYFHQKKNFGLVFGSCIVFVSVAPYLVTFISNSSVCQ